MNLGQHHLGFGSSHFGPAAMAATGARRRQASFGAFLNQAMLERGQRREDVEDQLA
jgi:hypothetical protein